ncbi:MAG: hypothetical protein ASARMPREDX12_004906 [Alectoria sarmentosa]|nr:MAG: hypothetical protein ASARMPREDX12_004906 [Alectoria sarmentosa]
MTSTAPPPGSTSLSHLLASLTPTLHPSTFVFLTFPPTAPPPSSLLHTAQLTFREAEGLTLITTLSAAQDHDLTEKATFRCRMITCEVHSSLEAVGFLAVITGRLRDLGMGVNPVSGFFHDHLFVPEGREGEAMGALRRLAGEARGEDLEVVEVDGL